MAIFVGAPPYRRLEFRKQTDDRTASAEGGETEARMKDDAVEREGGGHGSFDPFEG